MIADDAALLSQYVAKRSEVAFGELVRRHVDLVHSAALRQVGGDSHRAQDVTQAVFCELARNAPRLIGHRALSGWLYTTARFIGARLQRAETRRLIRERSSQAMSEIENHSATESLWSDLGPVLDEAMGALSGRDRTALVLRFFGNLPLAEVAAGLGTTENAARMRVDRALEKLRIVLTRRGVKSTSSVLGTVLMANAVAPAPVALASSLVGPAMAGAVGSVGIVPAMTLNLIHLMNSTKITVGISAVAMASVVGTYVGMNNANARLRAEVAALQSQPAPAVVDPVPSRSDPNVDPGELARLRAEHSELMRLRGEVGLLRTTADQLAAAVREKSQTSPLTDEQVLALSQSRGFRELISSAKMNYVRGWFMGCQAFAQQNGGKMPETMEEVEAFFEPPKGWEWTAGLLAKNDFEIVYHGSLDRIEHPERMILIREKQPYDVQNPSGPRKARTYVFADGHSEVHFSPDGDFDAWEKERMVASIP